MLAAAALTIVPAVLFGCTTVTTTTTALPPSITPVASPPDPTPTPLQELLLITDSELAWESDIETWASQRGLKFTVSNSSSASAYLRESKPHVAAVVSAGEALDGGLQQAASEGIPVVMVDVPGVEPGPLLSIVSNARHDQAGFLAGVMTGLASQTGWIGQVTATGGSDEQAYNAGFTQGLAWGCPKCQLISQTASEMTLDRFSANGVDVVFPFPGPDVADVVEALSGRGIPAVWVGENGPLTNMLVGRVVFEDGFAVILALEELMEQGEGRRWRPSIETYSIIPVDINDEHLSPGRQRLLEDAYWAISAGELDIGTEPDA